MQECSQELDPGDTRWGAKSSEHIIDDCNQARDRCLQEWWDGETYFDLGGRDQLEFERAVAATRQGKPVRNKSEAKKEVKQSKFITPSQDQEEKPGAMTKPVTRVAYDMRDFLESCVDRYCELAKVGCKSLKPAATPFHELRVALPIEPAWPDGIYLEQPSRWHRGLPNGVLTVI